MKIIQYAYRSGTYLPTAMIDTEALFLLKAPIVIVLNQEEKDYLGGLQLMHSKTLQIFTESDWFDMVRVKNAKIEYGELYRGVKLPLTFFATYQVSIEFIDAGI